MSSYHGGSDYAIKYAELDSLLRKHAAQKDRKWKSVETRLQETLSENRQLRDQVSTLTATLSNQRESAEEARRACEDAVKSDREELQLRQERLLGEEKSYERRLRHLTEKEEYLDATESSLAALRAQLAEERDALAAQQAQYEHAMTLTQRELDEERERAALTRREVDTQLEEAHRATQAAQQRKRDLDHLYTFERDYLGLVATELHDRMLICCEEASVRGFLLSNGVRVLWDDMSVLARSVDSRRLDIRARADLLDLKEKELVAKFRREQDCLKDDLERFALEKESFLLDCQSICRNIRFSLNDGVDSSASRCSLAALERAEAAVGVVTSATDSTLATSDR